MKGLEVYELTNPQKSIWFTEQYYKGTTVNNICGSVLIEQKVDLNLLNKAINKFIENNDSFRIRLKLIDGNVYQYFTEDSNYNFERLTLKDSSEIEIQAKQMVSIPFEMIDSKLFNFKLFTLANGYGGFIVNAHHIISDAATFSFIATEVTSNYSMLLKNEPIPKKEYSYVDYIKSEKDYLTSKRFEKDKEYWNEFLSPIPDVATIPLSDNIKDSPIANRLEFSLNKELLTKINNFCKETKISLYNFLIAVYSIYLGRINSMDVFTLGTPILNRTTYAEKHTSGMYINTSLLKIDLSKKISFIEMVQNIAKDCLSMLRHQKYNYKYIIEDLRQTDNSISNMYDILLSYQVTKATDSNIGIPYSSKWYNTDYVANTLDVHFHDNDDTGNILVEYDYQISKISNEEIFNMHHRIINIINQVLKNNTISIYDIEIVTENEYNTIMNDFNNTVYNFNLNSNANIINYIEIEASKTPYSIAIENNNYSITYKELINRINQLANYLISKNMKPNSQIGILTNKNIDIIVGILAILKINCTFVPIDPNYPIDRIEYMISNSKIDTILATETTNLGTNLDLIDINYNKYSSLNIDLSVKFNYNIDNNLYIVFTSGSTGKPKGATITHKNMLNLVLFQKNCTNILSQTRRILQFATMSFDVSYQEIFSALCTGSTLVLIDDNTKKDRIKLNDYILDNKIDTLFISPKYLLLLLEENKKIDILSKTLKHIITAGEQLIISDNIRKLIDSGVTIHNHYGPTETHVCTTFTINSTKDLALKPPIGKPISNSKIYILDSYQKLSPIGIVGNLYISGNCVGNGYINREDLTNERFIQDPYYKSNRMYKSGDLAKYDKDGNIYYIGRSDFQIKVNGFRIELEEVEHGILKLPYVKSASVTYIKDEMEKNSLLAFITFTDDNQTHNIKTDLIKIIPKYMIPNIFYKVKQLPLNNNGKVDKKILLTNLNNYEIISNTSEEYTEPKTDLEQSLLLSFRKILHNDNLSIVDDFFEFGGDSLSAIALQAECSKNKLFFNTQEIYDYPTVNTLAEHLAEQKTNLDNKENHSLNLTFKNVNLKKTNNIFIPGSNGFLGIHIIDSLLKTNNTLYCLVRSTENKTSSQRFLDVYKYYFNKDISDYIGSKIIVLDGDLSKDLFGLNNQEYIELAKKIDIIINCAASVKHYASRKYNYLNNVLTTTNLLQFAELGNCLFNHISTIGIAGNDLVNTNQCIKDTFSENDLFINQDYNSNVYIQTKYKAEELVLDYIKENKVSANILRVGNLMNRYIDNKFQINPNSNAFQNKIKAISTLGIIPSQFAESRFDLTPVDLCALAITKLALNNSYNNIYHVLNSKTLTFLEIRDILSDLSKNIKMISNEEIKTLVNNISEEQYDSYKWILNDLILNNTKRIIIDSNKTQKILSELDFKWNIISSDYYKKVFEYILKGDG